MIADIENANGLIETVATATYEQESSSTELNSSVMEIDRESQENAHVSENIETLVLSLNDDINVLDDIISKFKI